MSMTRCDLPTNAAALQTLVLEQQARLESQSSRLESQAERILILEEALRLAKHQYFGRRSEKTPADQLGLFNEAEQLLDTADPAERDEPESIQVPAHTRRRGGRKPLPEHLPRVEILHDLDASQKICPHDGTALEEISRETSEQLEMIPAQVRVLRHVRPKYACPKCRQGVHIAPMPAQMIPKSVASPSLLASIAVAKYADALPLYRQETILQRAGIELSRATLAHWMVKLGDGIQPLINLMRETLVSHDFMQCDETRFQVLKEPGKAATSQSYLWVQYGGPLWAPLILYEYDRSRSSEVPKRLLEGFQGYLQTDGYEGYAAVCEQNGLVHVGCWAHARRKFDEAVKGQGPGARKKNRAKRSVKETLALQALRYIRALYRIDRDLAECPPEPRHAARLERAQPVLAELRAWLDASMDRVPPQSLTGKAMAYLDKQWPKLVRYLDDGRIPLDTNRVENAIRPFVIGRKNWLFADTVRGAEASANIYSLIETAKANGLEPFAYLQHVITELPKAQTLEQVEALLPHALDPGTLGGHVKDAGR
jgi:transposase